MIDYKYFNMAVSSLISIYIIKYNKNRKRILLDLYFNYILCKYNKPKGPSVF